MKKIIAWLLASTLCLAVNVVSQFGSIAVDNPGINQSSSITGYEKIVAQKGTSLGTFVLATGPLLTGSIVAGGTFDSVASSIIITGNGAQQAPTGIIFTGTFNAPLIWSLQSTGNGSSTYTLSGTATGTFIKGQRAKAVVMETFSSPAGSGTYTQTIPATTVITLLGPVVKKSAKLSVPLVQANCGTIPPLCAGGLLKQTATVDQINSYWTKYNLTVPLSCRFMDPPLCATGERELCTNECTRN